MYNMLGHYYRSGFGVEKNYAEAVAWYRKAAEQGHPYAHERLARLTINCPIHLCPTTAFCKMKTLQSGGENMKDLIDGKFSRRGYVTQDGGYHDALGRYVGRRDEHGNLFDGD